MQKRCNLSSRWSHLGACPAEFSLNIDRSSVVRPTASARPCRLEHAAAPILGANNQQQKQKQEIKTGTFKITQRLESDWFHGGCRRRRNRACRLVVFKDLFFWLQVQYTGKCHTPQGYNLDRSGRHSDTRSIDEKNNQTPNTQTNQLTN